MEFFRLEHFQKRYGRRAVLFGSRRGPRGGVFPAEVALWNVREPREPAARRAAATKGRASATVFLKTL